MEPPSRLLMRALAPLWRRLPSPVQDAFVRLREPLFLVSVAGVISDGHDRVLLLEHRFRVSVWGLPGGLVARGEQPEDTLRREVREEVGVELLGLELAFARSLWDTVQIEMVFRGRSAGALVPDGFEVTAARWVPLAGLPADLAADQKEMIFRAMRRAPPLPARDEDALG
jgi:8-oxo-dGTP diphosphatase